LSEHSVDIVERIQLMQQARLHVAGVVLFDETAMHEAPAVPTWQPGPFVDQPARPAAAPEPPAAPAPPLPAFPVPPAAVPPPQSPTPAGPEVEPPAAPPHTPAPSSEPQGAAEPLPEPTAPTAMPHIPWSGRRNEEEQVAAPDSPAADEIPEIHLPEESSKRGPASGTPTVPAAPPEPAAASELRWDRPQKEAAPEEPPAQRPEPDAGEDRGWSIADADDAADADVRLATPADARRDSYEATDLEDAETEFAYDDGSNWSKMPLYILITLLVVIGGGFGWALWTKRGIERQVDEQMSDTDWIGEPQGTEPSAVPDDAAAMPGEDAQLPSSGLDALEGSESGGATAPSPPTGEGSSQPRTGEQQQASEPPAQTPRGSVTGGAAAAAGEAAGSGSEPTQPPPSTPSASPQRASSAATEFTYTVHVGSFRHLEQAYQDIATLQKHGFVGRAVKTDLGDKGIWYRVYVGGFATRSEAEQVRDSILELPEYRYAQVKRIPR
jgi:cell division protein FtsN